jgi:Cys-tRNA(Pro)/Cys-tRNA(Cys) deacylase
MSKTTRATQALDRAGVAYAVHRYDYEPDAERIGLQAAASLGAPPGRVLKTLMALVDDRPFCVLLASDREVNMKRLAAACGGKAASMMRPADAERFTGYHVGGISPFGQKKAAPVLVDEAALAQERVFVNGGQRGLQLELDPADILRALSARAAPLT